MSQQKKSVFTWADGREVPLIGQGTWHIGEKASLRQEEMRALQLGLDLGMTLVDTAEMYAEGGAGIACTGKCSGSEYPAHS
ncbi:hypothetical protein HPL003_13230 [Paenibacillus terrae HPL-003]|uniref:NADP-dependent oxidoreductase domain-containing protein n=1 Tax=Paenibacillus terrae (strain HPL-003) TaxID=985665 RepID=G7VXF7_PAETH|nr:aldo/keto reductase [Paenibacillus terrae]AET59399.1 hypothetical protein HPL003_13230 [Paenibacillus terrae HPL-003]